MRAEIYLVRHGETEWNRAGRWQGALDSPLTALGREQARGVGRVLARQLSPLNQLTARISPLGRTIATAEILFNEIPFDFPRFFDPELREISLGSWDGLTPAEIGPAENSTNHNQYFSSPDGDTYPASFARAQSWLAAQTGPVLAISHGMFGRLIRGAYLGLDPDRTLALPVPQDIVWRLANGQVEALR